MTSKTRLLQSVLTGAGSFLTLVVKAPWRLLWEGVAWTFAHFFKLVGAVFIVVIWSLLPTKVLEWAIPGRPMPLQILALVALFALVAYMVQAIHSTEKSREIFGGSLANDWPIVPAAGFVAFALPCFAGVSGFLVEHGWSRLTPTLEGAAPLLQKPDILVSRIADLYFWHALDLIPGLGIPGTLRWERPYSYEDPWTGLLVLFFKIIVFVSAFRLFRNFMEFKKQSKGNSAPVRQVPSTKGS